jgi:hypothetical protein
MTPQCDAALSYHGLGWSIIPIPRGQKKAALKWKRFQTECPDEAQLHAWFGNGHLLNMAVVHGSVSEGLTCLDFDVATGYHSWALARPDLAQRLPTVETARGFHVYGLSPGGYPTKHGDGRDFLGEGTYSLLPPSVHPDGSQYRWVIQPTAEKLIAVDPGEAGFWTNSVETHEGARGHRRSQELVRGGSREREKGVVEGEASTLVEDEDVQKVISETLPREFGTRHWRVFDLARSLRSMPRFKDADPRDLRPIVAQWHRRALPDIRTKEFEETWIDFLQGWVKIKHLKADGVVMEAFRRAAEGEPPPVAVARYPDNPRLQILVSLCRELQRVAGEEPFFLSTRTVGHLLSVEPKQAWRWLFLLEVDGILRVVKKGGGTGKDGRNATEFRYLGD